MITRLSVAICFAIAILLTQNADAFNLVPIDSGTLVVCPVKTDGEPQPQFNEPGCETVSPDRLDPQNTAIWLKAHIPIPAGMLDDSRPHGVYVSGKTSSRVYFNGHFLGQNGTPSLLEKDEFPGKIDAKFFVPATLIQPDDNHIVLQLSSHHGFLSLGNPVNFIGFGFYDDSALLMQRNLWLLLVPLGALALGALYFLVMSFSPLNRQTHVLFLLMSFLAACQLFAEISRTLFSYSYPLHDVRLVVIVTLAIGFGACLLVYIALKTELKRPWAWSIAGFVATILAVISTPGFDPKTTMAILVPAAFCTALITYRLLKQPGREWLAYFAVFLVFTCTGLLTLNNFHDILFYYVITVILCFLFVQQALRLNREQSQRKMEQARVARLQFKLEQNLQKDQSHRITISSAGKTERVDSSQVAYCKAAGDYVELYMKGGRQLLFSGSLKELEKQLPDVFLRVHRSYMVNLDYVQSLVSNRSGAQKTPAAGGTLLLTGGYEVPVSRRIMPMVRSEIKGN